MTLKEPPFFVVGSGRSGTTLVRSLLSAHPRLTVTPETHFMTRFDAAGARCVAAPADFDRFWAELIGWSRFRDLGVAPDDVVRRIETAGQHDFRTLFAAVLQAYAEKEEKPRVGEKTPGHFRWLDRIFTWFPRAQVIAVRRDPRAVIASQLRSPWVREEMEPGQVLAPYVRRLRRFHVAKRATMWADTYGHYLKAAKEDPRIHLVGYEDLVRDPEAEVSRMCAFLGETFEPGMLANRTGRDGGREAGAATARWKGWTEAHEQRAASAISTQSMETWRSELTPREVETIEAICGREMAAAGYARITQVGTGGARARVGRGVVAADTLEERLRGAVRRGRGRIGQGLGLHGQPPRPS